MEKSIKIKTKDNHIIYGTLNTLKKKSDKLIIFVHGLTGYKNEHIYYNAPKFFNPRGFATFRLDLYSEEKKARKLSECTVSLHAKDLNQIISYFKNRYGKLFLVGHSLGGITVLSSDIHQVSAVVLWDSSVNLKNGLEGILDYTKYNKCLDAYIVSWGCEYIIGKKMHKEWLNFPKPKELMARINKPIKIIVAGKGILVKGGKEYFKYANKPKAFAVVKGSHHNFDEQGAEEKLFRETWEWVRRYSN